MSGKIFMFILLLALPCYNITAQIHARPVKGTWINLAYQDERNKYMNPPSVDNCSPELWRLKVRELSEMGLEYIIIMYVANEGKAFYPSQFMAPAYDPKKESPVEAIMNAADQYNMKVFMSSGWAKNQDDNPGLPEIRAIQFKIMAETAKLFSGHRSFYGWYLPCEDVVGPFLSQRAVDAANMMSAEAKKLTPAAKVLISPYGLRMANFSDGKFARQIGKLKVDIIAYQDEVGCVVEPMPIPHLKQNYISLRQVHNKTGIAFWSNDESFTWEKGLNTRPSALIPAPFPRFLSQLCGAAAAGVDEVSSFAICGIYDKPGSEIPLGEPFFSSKAYSEYSEWREGKGRWPLLEATFLGTVENAGSNMNVTVQGKNGATESASLLVDGRLGTEDINDPAWSLFDKHDLVATVDMGSQKSVNSLAVRFLTYRLQGIYFPTVVEFALSEDGKNFREIRTVQMDQCLNDRYDCWIDIAFTGPLNERGRFIRVWAINGLGQKIMSDEIFINPKY